MLIPLAVASAQTEKISVDWKAVSVNNKFPEGPAWDALNKQLYVSNCYGNWITRIRNGKADTLVLADSVNYITTNGMIVNSSGDIYACDFGLGAIIKIENSLPHIFIEGYKGKPFNRPNDITFDRAGNLYFSDPKSYGKDKTDGRLFFYDMQKKELKLALDSLAFPNGLAISPADGRLYLSESAKNRVLSFRISEDGSLSDERIFIELKDGDPDGIEFDNAGNMYLAHFGSGTVFVISPRAEILRRIAAPGKKPSNVEFGGENMKLLFITEDETNSVYSVELKEIFSKR